MQRTRFSRIAGVFTIFIISATTAAAQERTQPRRTEVAKGITIIVPNNWMISEPRANNGLEILRPPAGRQAGTSAHMLLMIEQRESHAEALDRLASIAAQFRAVPTTQKQISAVRFFVLNYFPAVERRYQATLPLPGYPQPSPPGPGSASPSVRMTTRVVDAVAANDIIVRLEADILLPASDPTLLKDIQAIRDSLAATPPGNAAKAAQEIADVEKKFRKLSLPGSPGPGSATSPVLAALSATPFVATAMSSGGAARPGLSAVQGGFGELEVASNDGVHVVVASNSGISNSANGALAGSFVGSAVNGTVGFGGDPSISVAASNSFYLDFISPPVGGATPPPACFNSVSRSTDNGLTFNFVGNAVVCRSGPPGPPCLADQEHIAGDRFNSAGGQDQLYNVWRNFITLPGCSINTISRPLALIVCSRDSGVTWPTRALIGPGDFPRVAVGRDGFVYTVVNSFGMINLNKFSSCATGLVQQPGFPVLVAIFGTVACPVPGLDRCALQNDPSNPSVAADENDPNHLFIAYATNTATGRNEDVVIQDSSNAGRIWSAPLRINTAVPARRFMPGVCSTGGVAWVSWYDRRTATAANNSNTEFFLGSASVVGGTLTPGTEANLSGVPDPQCASGFPCGTLDPANATRCVPAVAAPGPGGNGCPKYGDYNGIGCANGMVFPGWSSAVPPLGLAAPGPGISVYADGRNGAFASTGVPVFTCDQTCPNLRNCYGIGELNTEPRFCFPQGPAPTVATNTGLLVNPGAPVPPVTNPGGTPVFRCVQLCPNLGFCYGRGQLTTRPDQCFPKGPLPRPTNVAFDTGLRVLPGAAVTPAPLAPPNPPPTTPVFRCAQICLNPGCYGQGQLTTDPTFCFPQGPLPRPPTVAIDTGLRVR